jgi:hypothetical protein
MVSPDLGSAAFSILSSSILPPAFSQGDFPGSAQPAMPTAIAAKASNLKFAKPAKAGISAILGEDKDYRG